MTNTMTNNTVTVNGLGKALLDVILSNINYCDNSDNRVITECEFVATENGELEIWIRSNCDGWAEDVKILDVFSNTLEKGIEHWFTFISNDFIGLTETQALTMIDWAIGDFYCLPDNDDSDCFVDDNELMDLFASVDEV